MSAVASLLAVLALGYAALLGAMYVGQERLIFLGEPLAADYRFDFAQDFDEVFIDVPGARLHALHLRQPEPHGLVFFLHGNAGNLATWTTGAEFYRKVNYDLFMLDYRGYGKSTGRIESEAQLHADVRAAWDTVAPRYRGQPIVIYGRSLGTGLAVKLALEVDADLVVLVSPYSSAAALAREAYPFVPSALVRYPLRSDERIGALRTPLMILHGSADTVIPYAHAQRLHALAPAGAELLAIEGAGHNDIHEFPSYLDALAQRLRTLTVAPARAPSPPAPHR